VISQFLHSHNPDIWCDQTSAEVKTLVRHGFPLNYYGAHRPFHDEDMPRDQQPKWTDASGRGIPVQFRKRVNKRRIRAFPAGGARKFATLNHYALRSLDSYLVKNDRGDVNREYREFDDTYWRERNDAAYFDDSILRYMDPLRKEMDALMALPGVADLHEEAVHLHLKKRDELLETEHYQKMRETLLNASPYPPQEEAILKEIGAI
ncbi:MAG: glycosyltransferase family 2 protein, partial [Pseudomonadota bacterium]